MSDQVIRALLETRLDTLLPAIPTVKENTAYVPVKGTNYQRVFVLMGQTENPTLGDGFKRERGIFQVNLYFQESVGTGASTARAEAIKTLFKRGTTLEQGSVRVQVYASPYAAQGSNNDGFFMLPVSVPFTADVHV